MTDEARTPVPGVHKPDESREFYTGERCHILEISGADDDPECSIARARVEPGVTTELHALDIAERYLIVQGRGEMELGVEPAANSGLESGDSSALEKRIVLPGDVVLIPPHVAQRITNAGEEDLVFYCVCTPAWTEGVYRSLE